MPIRTCIFDSYMIMFVTMYFNVRYFQVICMYMCIVTSFLKITTRRGRLFKGSTQHLALYGMAIADFKTDVFPQWTLRNVDSFWLVPVWNYFTAKSPRGWSLVLCPTAQVSCTLLKQPSSRVCVVRPWVRLQAMDS